MQTNQDDSTTGIRRASAGFGTSKAALGVVGSSGAAAPLALWQGSSEVHLPAPRGRGGLERQLTIALRTDDPLTVDGATAYFQSVRQPIRILPAHQSGKADVLLIIVFSVTEETLSWMRQAGQDGRSRRPRSVLVAESITKSQLMQAVGYGLTSFLNRQQVGFGQVLRTVVNSRDGRAELPDTVVASLIEQLQSAQRARESGADAGWLTPREVEVLRHLSEGLDTMEIASRLSYSERTIKNTIHGMLTRLGLRNRTHAVAHGIRTGLI